MRRVAEAQQPGQVPFAEPVQSHVEQLHLVPRRHAVLAAPQPRRTAGEGGEELVETARAELRVGTFRNDRGALPVVTPIDEHAEHPVVEVADQSFGVPRMAGYPEPPGVDRARILVEAEFGKCPGERVPAVTGGGDRRAQFARGAFRVAVPDPAYAPAFVDQGGGFGVHSQREGGLLFARVGEQVEKVPLRHQSDVVPRRVQGGQVTDGEEPAIRCDGELHPVDTTLRQRVEPLGQAEIVDQVHRRRVDGVPAEVAEEVVVLFQDGDVDAAACQQQTEDHARRPAADDATGGLLHEVASGQRSADFGGVSRKAPCASTYAGMRRRNGSAVAIRSGNGIFPVSLKSIVPWRARRTTLRWIVRCNP